MDERITIVGKQARKNRAWFNQHQYLSAVAESGYRYVSSSVEMTPRVSFCDRDSNSADSWLTYNSPQWSNEIAGSVAAALVNSGLISRYREKFSKLRAERLLVLAKSGPGDNTYSLWSLHGANAWHVPVGKEGPLDPMTRDQCLERVKDVKKHYTRFVDAERFAKQATKKGTVSV